MRALTQAGFAFVDEDDGVHAVALLSVLEVREALDDEQPGDERVAGVSLPMIGQ